MVKWGYCMEFRQIEMGKVISEINFTRNWILFDSLVEKENFRTVIVPFPPIFYTLCLSEAG